MRIVEAHAVPGRIVRWVHPMTLGGHYNDVRRLICAHPSYRGAVAAGIDADDLLQDVLLRVHTRWSSWDPSRGGLSKWVWLVTRTSIWNYRRSLARLVEVPTEGELGLVDQLEEATAIARACAELGLSRDEARLAQLLAEGRVARTDPRARTLQARVVERGEYGGEEGLLDSARVISNGRGGS